MPAERLLILFCSVRMKLKKLCRFFHENYDEEIDEQLLLDFGFHLDQIYDFT
jgi:hypothetical protein